MINIQKCGAEMQSKDIIIENIEKIHTTEMGIERISKNLGISGDVVDYCKTKILQDNSEVVKKGKNFYVDVDDCIITVKSSSYTIITAHKK
jgi:hypothetical protein